MFLVRVPVIFAEKDVKVEGKANAGRNGTLLTDVAQPSHRLHFELHPFWPGVIGSDGEEGG